MFIASPLAIAVVSQPLPADGPDREAVVQHILASISPFLDVQEVARLMREGQPIPFPLPPTLGYPLARFENER